MWQSCCRNCTFRDRKQSVRVFFGFVLKEAVDNHGISELRPHLCSYNSSVVKFSALLQSYKQKHDACSGQAVMKQQSELWPLSTGVHHTELSTCSLFDWLEHLNIFWAFSISMKRGISSFFLFESMCTFGLCVKGWAAWECAASWTTSSCSDRPQTGGCGNQLDPNYPQGGDVVLSFYGLLLIKVVFPYMVLLINTDKHVGVLDLQRIQENLTRIWQRIILVYFGLINRNQCQFFTGSWNKISSICSSE